MGRPVNPYVNLIDLPEFPLDPRHGRQVSRLEYICHNPFCPTPLEPHENLDAVQIFKVRFHMPSKTLLTA
jgi:hypothetical protein